jgi:hypothetical protein
MVKEDILSKVKKLLAVAEGSNFEQEAQNAMLKAQEFMIKHGVTIEDINYQEGNKEVVDQSVAETGRMPWYWKRIMVIVGDNFRCKAYRSKGIVSKVCFIGLKEDVKIAKEIFNYAINTVEICAKNYTIKFKRPGINISGIKNDYIQGFINGLRDKFKEQVESKGFALILVKDDVVIERIEKKGLVKDYRSSHRVNRNQIAKQAGYQQGRNFQNPSRMINDY